MWIVRLLLMFICCFRHNRETFSFSLFSASTRAYSLFLLFLMHMGISPSIFIDSENIVASFLLFDNALCTSSMVLILSKISVQRAFIECQKVLVAQRECRRVSVWWKYLRMNRILGERGSKTHSLHSNECLLIRCTYFDTTAYSVSFFLGCASV